MKFFLNKFSWPIHVTSLFRKMDSLAEEVAPAPENGIVQFEELTDVCYNQDLCKLQATLLIHDLTGYNGNICGTGSKEYIRFFVDSGKGFRNAGFTSVQVYDLTEPRSKKRLPHKHLVQLYYENTDFRISAGKEIRIKAILSWNELPPANPSWPPTFGNVCESTCVLKPGESLIGELLDEITLPKPVLFQYLY
jgi:hypothetical protein